MSHIHRLGLGTAQFGSHYGATNKLGQPTRKECEQIVWRAYDAGIRYFDTAAYYGDADAILALSLPGPAKVTSKAKTPADIERTEKLFGKNLYGIYGTPGCQSIYWELPEVTNWLIQLPLNLADQRNLLLARIFANRGAEIHARSVFLQGKLLEAGATVRQCLKFVLDQPIDAAIVGVNSVAELDEIIAAVETLDEETAIPHLNIAGLDPREWEKPHADH